METNGKNGVSLKKQKTAEKIIEKVAQAQGLLTLTAKATGLGYRTVCRYVAENEDVRNAVADARESMVDLAEGKLFQAINNGELTAIIFFLKTRGKQRGYVERSELTGAEGVPLASVNVYSNQTKQDIETAIKRFSAN